MTISGRELERAIVTEFCAYAAKINGGGRQEASPDKKLPTRAGKSNRRISWQKAQRVASYWGIDELIIG